MENTYTHDTIDLNMTIQNFINSNVEVAYNDKLQFFNIVEELADTIK